MTDESTLLAQAKVLAQLHEYLKDHEPYLDILVPVPLGEIEQVRQFCEDEGLCDDGEHIPDCDYGYAMAEVRELMAKDKLGTYITAMRRVADHIEAARAALLGSRNEPIVTLHGDERNDPIVTASDDSIVTDACAQCGKAMSRRPGSGRRRAYCSDRCRQRAYRARS